MVSGLYDLASWQDPSSLPFREQDQTHAGDLFDGRDLSTLECKFSSNLLDFLLEPGCLLSPILTKVESFRSQGLWG